MIPKTSHSIPKHSISFQHVTADVRQHSSIKHVRRRAGGPAAACPAGEVIARWRIGMAR
jgi:hypothetical protein